MGIRKDTGNRPQGAQRCLKIAANRVGSVYRGAADYPTCTEIEQNIIHFVQSHVPARFRLALPSWHRISVFRCCQD